MTRRWSWLFNSQRQAKTDGVEFLQRPNPRYIRSRGAIAAERKPCLAAAAAVTASDASVHLEESRTGQPLGKRARWRVGSEMELKL